MAYEDWCIAQLAAKAGNDSLAAAYQKKAEYYKRYLDPETKLMRPVMGDGSFRTPFNPFSSSHRADDYCEGNAWQYTWLAPHDFDGLVECFGSTDAFLAKLDSLFTVSPEVAGTNTSPDISGLIGQYAHGNEPSHHILYFYTMAGEPWKTADKVRNVLTTLYDDTPAGLSGNEDVGQMSAWYVLSALGFYQADMTRPCFWFGYPMLDEAVIKVPGGEFVVRTRDNSPENIYIQSVTLNGKPYDKSYISHDDIAAGGRMEFVMGGTPNKEWAASAGCCPPGLTL